MLTSINEFRKQLTLPFKEKDFKGKSLHEHLVDALIDLQTIKDPNSYFSNTDPETFINKEIENIFKKIQDVEYNDNTLIEFFYSVIPFDSDGEINTEYSNIWNKQFLTKYKDEIFDEDKITQYNNIQELLGTYSHDKQLKMSQVLTTTGIKKFHEFLKNYFETQIADMIGTIEQAYQHDNNGLIDVWRTIDYKTKNKDNDYYLDIVEEYNGVGVYWTWDKAFATAYWGNGGHSITLHGKISTENIHWNETLIMNGIMFNEEKEIRTINNGNIMIVDFHDDTINKTIQLEQPYVVKTGSATR